MKKYVLIALHPNNRTSLYNQALYDSEQEAQKFADWFMVKYEAEQKASELYWNEKPTDYKRVIFPAEVTY